MDEQTRAALPDWVREIAERASLAGATEYQHVPITEAYAVLLERLIATAAGMAQALELLVAIFYGDDGPLAKTTMHDGDCHDYGMARYAVAMALANWRGRDEQL